jgi:hypothetical protein
VCIRANDGKAEIARRFDRRRVIYRLSDQWNGYAVLRVALLTVLEILVTFPQMRIFEALRPFSRSFLRYWWRVGTRNKCQNCNARKGRNG